MKKFLIVAVLILGLWPLKSYAQERPFIWVKADERKTILEKIEHQPWANSLYKSFEARMEEDFQSWKNNPSEFLKQLPFDWEKGKNGEIPPFKIIIRGNSEEVRNRILFINALQLGIDCGMFYYLTGKEEYAQCALDILYTFIQGVSQIPLPTEIRNQGWIYREDHLFEVRIINAQVPVIYDFVAPFIKNGGQPFDFAKSVKTSFPDEIAQKVFYNYAKLVIEQGMTGSNWSVLEAPALVQNTLALNNISRRDSLLDIYLNKGSERQDPFVEIASHYRRPGDVYPETSQYSNGVTSLSTTLMALLTRYNPDLHLGQKYPLIPQALSEWESLKYPNNEIVRFGDGHRHGSTNYKSCEMAYYLGELDSVPELSKTFGIILNTAISNGEYKRGRLGNRSDGANSYFEPLQLLWGSPEIDGDVKNRVIPRTDLMPHASVYLQRNLSETGKAEDGLMCAVMGAHMVHGHAEGMNIELYGKGQVLGVDHGRGSYRNDLHENYSRLFAAHNTVIVNGNSRSDSGWVNLGINSVQLIAMEPMPRTEALSPNHSFTTTGFIDDRGDLAEANQERTLALIRTSKTTGYYVDVFRSKSKLPNEYHDYLYHNIGDKVEFLNVLELKSTPNRYKANEKLPWVQNRQYRHPGWHFFEEVQTSSIHEIDVTARFSIEQLDAPIFMDLYIPGFGNREYTRVKAPRTFEAPEPYHKMETPTLVIRKYGEAWTKPFIVVFEPSFAHKKSIVSVEKLTENGTYKGLKVESSVEGKKLVQYILTLNENESFEDKTTGIVFKGRFAVITCDEKGDLLNIYMGDGYEISYKNTSITVKEESASAYLDLTADKPELKSNKPEKVTCSTSN